MTFRPAKKIPQFSDLKGILAQSVSRQNDNSLYQTIKQIIERLTHYQIVNTEQLKQKLEQTDADKRYANKFATFLTKNDDTGLLPNSIQLLAGTNITFDDTVLGKRTINSSGGGGSDHYDAPLSDGDTTAADLIYANGECIIVQVPV
jgi:hypothetical protein